VKEVSQLLNVHERTVQCWKNEGLKSLTTSKPFLFMGFELKQFLAQKKELTNVKLEPNQFYCTKCRKAVSAKDSKVILKHTNKALGNKGFEEVIIQGYCEICSTRINRFSHSGKLAEIKNVFTVKENLNNE
jgi:Zn finger protein HypA/HybF involved in hydrogenase expression